MKHFNTVKHHKLMRLFAIVISLSISHLVLSDDTEIYQSIYTADTTGARPKVLIVFDDSGSMGTEVTQQPPPFDPDIVYTGSYNSSRIYWSTSANPPSSGTDQWFDSSRNRCAESLTPLDENGFFQTKAQRARWRSRNSSWRWTSLSRDVNTPDHVDCQVDVVNDNPSNPGHADSGYPEQRDLYSDDGSINWGSTVYTFYSANYLNWYSAGGDLTRTRLEIAQATVTDLVNANTGVDFGLLVFNDNDAGEDGGRIVQRIITDMDADDRTNLINVVDGFESRGWTPICESVYESYRYLTGQTLVYGDERDTYRDVPARDLLAESPVGTYDAPTAECAYVYIIIMTDGKPSYDTDANNAIESLTGKTCAEYEDDNGWYGDNMSKNCLPEIAEYMANNDLDGDSSNGSQFGITYTIGFATDQDLLSDTAAKGKGDYYTADNAQSLADAFQGAITSILATNASFTSPAVAVDAFTKTQSLNEMYFAMFEPEDRVDWAGNIKKLNLTISAGVATATDADGQVAIDPATGHIKVDARTIWSVDVDGEEVHQGGAGELLAGRDPATRVLYSNTGSNGALEALNESNMDAAAYGFDTDAELFSYFDVTDQTELAETINYARGFDVDDIDEDGSTIDPREWILADILHSRPLVINYGGAVDNPDLRIVVGTNGGFLHMFGNSDGIEDWAFFPKELAPILEPRRTNNASTDHVYGIDSPPALYRKDINDDGTINYSAGDKVYLYFGLRRGGKRLYALDISNPAAPSFLWSIDDTVTGFEELGQTWSTPNVAFIPGYADNNGDPKPVLIFGAGYDTNKDSDVVASPDSMGRGVFIVDATTGAKVWGVTPAANSSSNLQELDLEHSVPGVVSPLDSNGDNLVDRIYFSDTGGNVWRVDLYGNSLPTSSQDSWFITQMAALNGGTVSTDRRFFNAPDVVRTEGVVTRCFQYSGSNCAIVEEEVQERTGGTAFDILMIGSGDRTNPNAIDVDNRFYMMRDLQLTPYSTARPSAEECVSLLSDENRNNNDFRCFLPITDSDLTNTTSSIATSDLLESDGWYVDLAASGEKSLSRSLTFAGKVYFTTFSPDATLTNVCTPQPGTGRLYIADVFDSAAKVDFNHDGLVEISERSVLLGSLIPDTPSPHLGSDRKIRLLFPSGGGVLGSVILDTETTLPSPYASYWYQEEY